MLQHLPIPTPEHALVFEPNYWVWDDKSYISTAEYPLELLPANLQPVVRELRGVPLLFQFSANSFYDWHLDRTRLCALNWEVKGKGTLLTGDKDGKVIRNVQEHRYKGALLLNTQRWHAVWNHEPRLVLSVGFNKHVFDVVLASLNSPLDK